MYSTSHGKKITVDEVRKQSQYVVGKTRVFIRSAQYKSALEKIRDSKASNCSVPLQKIVRGFIMRNRFVHKIASMRKVAQERRVKEQFERECMQREEVVSMHVEQVFRSDSQLQAKLLALKTDRIRAETGMFSRTNCLAIFFIYFNCFRAPRVQSETGYLRIHNQISILRPFPSIAERKRVLELNAATLIQRIYRGTYTRSRGRIYMCETMLERALSRRDELMINRAMVLPALFGVTSKLIKVNDFDFDFDFFVLESCCNVNCVDSHSFANNTMPYS